MQLATSKFGILRDVSVVIIGMFILGTFAFAANFSDPISTPPAGNTAVPLNVGSADQTKSGDFWADSVGSNDGYCLGEDCITSWPAGVTGSTCHIETRKVQNQDPQSSYTVGIGCTVSAADVANGWIVSDWDHCTGVHSRDCSGPEYCAFMRLVCDGSVTIAPGTITRQ
jgi:hypothetical protein